MLENRSSQNCLYASLSQDLYYFFLFFFVFLVLNDFLRSAKHKQSHKRQNKFFFDKLKFVKRLYKVFKKIKVKCNSNSLISTNRQFMTSV